MESVEIVYVTVFNFVTTIGWSDGTTTVSSLDARKDLFDIEKGVLYGIAKKFISTSDILRAIDSGRYSLSNPGVNNENG